MTTLVTGGSKCGKSRYAEKIFDNFSGKKFYIATMQPYGEEAFAAIERHRKIRAGKGFETIEKYTDIAEINLPENCGILLECTANLCANEMFRDGGIFDPTEKIIRGFEYLKSRANALVIVTNEVGGDGVFYEKGTADYIKIMGGINRRTAEISDNVIECVYGIPLPLKGVVI
ncbi:MAG: bifunctional adenosylcobinamide kinase/adenosylcobinamide-phosphate guanylyltransferase [Ruminococcus sp.]|nr:bifunctional adenosylcobinamide kinase/adenosylcobinamide-phosphate guanylyltransferase [Ruminococcus sp.]MCM1382372.1 bifunctional adenosylcobinamide kinase/adenosylcobinamide-phosphate guanylyltransferase [Muribaculaceae bacterium]MCM1480369.1 bifunctional adenosylcobinamide kinase/adenosylcobinamide-phosphate guanylyltransferase [Muribaculaceae bacterium]